MTLLPLRCFFAAQQWFKGLAQPTRELSKAYSLGERLPGCKAYSLGRCSLGERLQGWLQASCTLAQADSENLICFRSFLTWPAVCAYS